MLLQDDRRHDRPALAQLAQDRVDPAVAGEGLHPPVRVGRVGEAHRRGGAGERGHRLRHPPAGALVEEERRRERAVVEPGGALLVLPGEVAHEEPPLGAPEAAHVAAARSASAAAAQRFCARRVAGQPGDRREGRLQDRRGEQVEGALLVARPREAVVDPDRGHAPALDRQQAVLPAPREEVVGEADEARVEVEQQVRLARLEVVAPGVVDERHAVVEERPPRRRAHLALRDPVEAVEGRPAVEEEAVRRLAHRERAQEAPRELAVAAHEARRVQLVGAVAAVLLALAAHAVDDRLLRGVDERVERGLEDALQPRLRRRRSSAPSARGSCAGARPTSRRTHRARGVVHVHLQEAQRLVVERLEAVLALAADEARPAEAVGVEPGGAGGVVRLLRHQLDHGAGRRLDGQEREADHLLRQLERREGALARGRLEPPRALPRRRRRGLVHDLEGAGHAVLEPVARVAEPAHAARSARGGPTGRNVSRTSGTSRARSTAAAGSMPPSVR